MPVANYSLMACGVSQRWRAQYIFVDRYALKSCIPLSVNCATQQNSSLVSSRYIIRLKGFSSSPISLSGVFQTVILSKVRFRDSARDTLPYSYCCRQGTIEHM